jgi:hypothetical protein
LATAVRWGSRVDAGLVVGCVVLSLAATALSAKDSEPIAMGPEASASEMTDRRSSVSSSRERVREDAPRVRGRSIEPSDTSEQADQDCLKCRARTKRDQDRRKGLQYAAHQPPSNLVADALVASLCASNFRQKPKAWRVHGTP